MCVDLKPMCIRSNERIKYMRNTFKDLKIYVEHWTTNLMDFLFLYVEET